MKNINNIINISKCYSHNKIRIITDYKQIFCYIVLITSFMNATLRLTNSGMSVVYRIISPFIFIPISIKYFNQMKKTFVFYIVFVCYSLLVSIFYNHIDISGYIFALYLMVEIIIIRYLKIKQQNFSAIFFSFLDINTVVIIIFGFIQYICPFTMPHLPERGHTITFYFWNENELSEAIACMSIIYLYRFFFMKQKVDGIKALFVFVIIYINDSKLSLLGVIFACSIFLFYKIVSKLNNTVKLSSWSIFVLGIFFITLGIVLIFMLHLEFHFRDYTISLNELALKGIRAIITLHPLEGLGSEIVRANAIIFGLKELSHSFFVGIGWQNSVFMLEKPQFYLETAKSMHNIIVQFLCEMGYFAIFCYMKIIVSGLRKVKYININNIFLLKITFGLSFMLISSQSSIGILSNYFTWAIVIYMFYLDDFFLHRGDFAWSN